MGGRGASSGLGKDNIVAFRQNSDTGNPLKWNYPSEVKRVNMLIEYANKAKSINQINRAALALKKQDEHISTLIKNAKDEDGDVNVLMTLRRKVREQRKKTRL